jgi:two-component system response regulator DesR
MPDGYILVLEDDAHVARGIARLVSSRREARVARTIGAARTILAAGGRIEAAIIDVVLPDGNGLDLAAEIRERRGPVPMLVLTAHAEKVFINRAQALGLEYACKPDHAENLLVFVDRALAPRARAAGIDLLRPIASRYALSQREVEILGHAMAGRERDEIARDLGVTENTIKTEIKSLLRKCDAESLSDLVRAIRARR